MNKKIAIVTGGTSGIGKATALALRGAGYTVYEFSRREAGVEGLHHIRADITDETQVRAAVQQVMDAEGQIDVVVNNAGFGISGAVEFTDTADAQRLFNADFFGMVRVNRAVIAHMRAAGRGRIVNLSSVAGPLPIPFQTYYSAAKAAVNAYTMALANELRPFGITVCAAACSRAISARASPPRGKRPSPATKSTAGASAAPSRAWSTTSRLAWILRPRAASSRASRRRRAISRSIRSGWTISSSYF